MPDMMALQVQPPASIGPAVANLLQMRQQQSTQADASAQNAAELELRRAQLGVEQGKLSQQNALMSAYQTGDPEAVFRAGDPAGAKSAVGYKSAAAAADAWGRYGAAAASGDEKAFAALTASDPDSAKILTAIAGDKQNIAASVAKMGQERATFQTQQQAALGGALIAWSSEPDEAKRAASIPTLAAMAKRAGVTDEQIAPIADAASKGNVDAVAHVGKVLFAESQVAQQELAKLGFGVTNFKAGDYVPPVAQTALGLPAPGLGASTQPSAMPTAGQRIAPPPGATAPGLAPVAAQGTPAQVPMLATAPTPALGGLPTTQLPGGGLSVGGSGGASGPYTGTGMDAQNWNILLKGDRASPAYAAAYAQITEPRMQITTLEDGTQVAVPMRPQIPPSVLPPLGAAGARPAGGASPPAGPGSTPLTGLPEGSVVLGTKPPTEQVVRARSLYSVAESDLQTVKDTFEALADPGAQVLAYGGDATRWAQSDDYQRGANALKSIIAAFLYTASGQAIPDSEAARQANLLMPQLGEHGPALDEKLKRIQTYVDSIRKAANLSATPGATAPTGEDTTATNPATGERVILKNGQWVPYNG